MRALLFAFTERGLETARHIQCLLAEAGDIADIRTTEKLAREGCPAYEGPLPAYVGGVFDRDALIFVGACGIAVRAIAPYVASKKSDPAVICVDEKGLFIIPILSGHIGGANALARRLASGLDATPVITTATDVNGRFSVDTWATEHGMVITDMKAAKRVSAEILTREIPICTDAPGGIAAASLPDGLVPGDQGELGICVSPRDLRPFEETLLLIPRALRLGIGCRRGISKEAIESAVDRVLRDHNLRVEAVAGAASIDVKRDETGFIQFCEDRGWSVAFYSAEQLKGVPGDFTPSDFVRNTVGVDNVCERAAMIGGGRLIVPKTAMDGVTVAVAEMEWGIEF